MRGYKWALHQVRGQVTAASPWGGGQAPQAGMSCLVEFDPIRLQGRTPGFLGTPGVDLSQLSPRVHRMEGQLSDIIQDHQEGQTIYTQTVAWPVFNQNKGSWMEQIFDCIQ